MASACGSEQRVDSPTLMVAEQGSSVASPAPGQGRPALEGSGLLMGLTECWRPERGTSRVGVNTRPPTSVLKLALALAP